MMIRRIDNEITRLSRLRTALLLTASLLVSASVPASLPREEAFKAPVATLAGETVDMPGRLCRPARPGPARLVLFVHGTSPVAAENATTALLSCGSPRVWWFTQRGYAVASFLRPGYGASPGQVEDRPAEAGSYEKAALLRASDIDAAVNAATALRGVRPDGAIVVGASTGGFGAVAYDAQPHPRVAALISFAGGQGGWWHGQPGSVCNLPGLASAAATFGRTASTPMLWVYADNDSFFSPYVAAVLARAFQQGGGLADLQLVPAFAADGHRLLSDPMGSAVWGPLVTDYLARMEAMP